MQYFVSFGITGIKYGLVTEIEYYTLLPKAE
jgi:hypothetical protein